MVHICIPPRNYCFASYFGQFWIEIDTNKDGQITFREYLSYRERVDVEFASKQKPGRKQKEFAGFFRRGSDEIATESESEGESSRWRKQFQFQFLFHVVTPLFVSEDAVPKDAVLRLKRRFDGIDVTGKGELTWEEVCENRNVLFPTLDNLSDSKFESFLKKKLKQVRKG